MELHIYSKCINTPIVVLTSVKDYSIDKLGIHVLQHNGNRNLFSWNKTGENSITRVKAVK